MLFTNCDDEYKNNKMLKREDVKILQEWMDKQQHLPKISELKIIIFLHSCFFKIEPTKTCIENYYTMRSRCPEFFANRNPKNIRETLETILCTFLQTRTEDGCNVFLTKILDTNPDKYHFTEGVKAIDMAISLNQMKVGNGNGEVIIFDMQGPTFSHLLKVNLMALKKYMYFLQEALPVRIKAVHITHANALTDKLISMARPFIKNELMKVIHVHQDMESLYEHIPKDFLPKEYGGNGGTFEDMKNRTIKLFEEYSQYFIDEEKEVADESRRQGRSSGIDDIFGTEGTFKKLDID